MALSIWVNLGSRVRTMVEGRDNTHLLEPHVSYLHAQLRLGVTPFALSKRLLADRGVSVCRAPMRNFLAMHPLEASPIMQRPAGCVGSVEHVARAVLRRPAAAMPVEPGARVILRRPAASMPDVVNVCREAGLEAYHAFLVSLFREGMFGSCGEEEASI